MAKLKPSQTPIQDYVNAKSLLAGLTFCIRGGVGFYVTPDGRELAENQVQLPYLHQGKGITPNPEKRKMFTQDVKAY